MTEQTATTEVQAPTAEDLQKMFNELPPTFQEAIKNVNTQIAEHNKGVATVKASKQSDPKQLKHEIFEASIKEDGTPAANANKGLVRLRQQELQLLEQLEKIRTQAYKVIDENGLMPKAASEEEIEKLKSSLSENVKSLRDQSAAIEQFEVMMPTLKGKLSIHLSDIQTLRGVSTTRTSSTGDGPKRLRFKKILVNGETEDENGNKVYGEVKKDGTVTEKFTFGFLAKFFSNKSSTFNWTTKDFIDAYLEGQDENNLPDSREFQMVHNYKDENGNEQSVTFNITAIR